MRYSLTALALGASAALAQQPPANSAPDAGAQQAAPTRHGTVLFERHADAAATPSAAAQDLPQSAPEISDAERTAITITSYDLDAQLKPAISGLQMRARLTLRNDGPQPLTRLALQISSTLTWVSVSLAPSDGTATERLPLVQHLIDTDADHTGKADEVVISLPSPLAAGASLALDTFYSGTIAANGARLERIGATPAAALDTDWDAIAPLPNGLSTALRGLGSVLWVPVAAPPLFLGDGAKLFQFIGATRLREQNASVHLRVAVEYSGEPPTAVYFCGRRRSLAAISDDVNSPVAAGHGIAAAEFVAAPLGFRLPSLFVVDHAEERIAPAPAMLDAAPQGDSSSSSSSRSDNLPPSASIDAAASDDETPLLAVETEDDGALPRLAASVETIAPLLQRWFGARPPSALTVLDHGGQPFEDGPLLVAPVSSLAGSGSAVALTHSLTHAWVQTGQPWMDEGLAQFAALLWVEQQQGREAAVAQLQDLMLPLNLAEIVVSPDITTDAGQPLIAASDELYYRRKAAAVWWMLRDITGDQALQAALKAWCAQPVSAQSAHEQSVAFERLLEKTSGKELGWFFADWVLRDRGLPDLTIVSVEPHLLPAGQAHGSSWLVSVTVHNEGGAVADVPLVIRSGSFSATRRMRIPAFASTTERVLVETPPSQVVVNDGGMPEVRSSTHSVSVDAPPR
jgi:hypothetical protein